MFGCANRVGVKATDQFTGCSCVIDLRRRAPRVLRRLRRTGRSLANVEGSFRWVRLDDDGDDDDEVEEEEDGDDEGNDEEGDRRRRRGNTRARRGYPSSCRPQARY